MAIFEWQDSDPPWEWWHGGGSSAESRRLKGHGKRPCGDPERHVYILCIMYIRTYDYNPKTRVLQNRGMVQLGSPQECFNHLRVFSVGHGLAASNMIISPWRNQCFNIWTSYAMLSGKKWTLPASYSPSKYLDRWEKIWSQEVPYCWMRHADGSKSIIPYYTTNVACWNFHHLWML